MEVSRCGFCAETVIKHHSRFHIDISKRGVFQARETVNEEDIKKAIQLVILPRAEIQDQQEQSDEQPPPPPPPPPQDQQEEQDQEDDEEDDQEQEDEQEQEDKVSHHLRN